VQQCTRNNTNLQSQYCGTAPYSLRSTQAPAMRAPSTSRAYDAATTLHIFAGPMRTAAHADQCRAPRHHHTRTRARRHTHDATSPTQHNTMSASWRVSAKHQQATHAHRTLTRSEQTHTPRTPARRPAQPQPLRTAQTSLQAHRRTHATHSTAHNSAHPTRRQQKITPSHTRGLAPHSPKQLKAAQRRRDAAGELIAVQVQLPAGHTNSHRVTPWHPTPPPTPASRPQRIAA
jgi:hypothetical protein